ARFTFSFRADYAGPGHARERRAVPPSGQASEAVQQPPREDRFMVSMNRRQFLKVSGTSLAGSSLALLGASPAPALAEVRQYKLARMTESRNTCPYCSVSCGLLMYGLGDGSKNAASSIVHIEGDP